MAEDQTPEEEQIQPEGEEQTPDGEEPTPEEAAPEQEQPSAEETPAAEESSAEESSAEEPKQEARPPKKKDKKKDEDEVVPGAHLEPDLVLEEESAPRAEPESEFAEYAEEGDAAAGEETPADEAPASEEPARAPLELAADARYSATGKRKTAVARVILRPGSGTYTINGRTLDEYFPRALLRDTARGPLQTVGYEASMDVTAKIHGGGVAAQAGALRHGVARALVEADPALRTELKRRGFLTRDARAKERKKAGLKKARKRPQFSKR